MNNVMIDIESLGTKANSVILSIAALRFNPATGELGDYLLKKITIQSCLDAGLEIDADTLMWWMEQDQRARELAFPEQSACVPLSVALAELSGFITDNDFVWANPIDFDLTIIENARCKLFFPEKIWNRRNVMCLRTLKNIVPKPVYETEFTGIPHDPLDDCAHQVKQAHKIYNHLNL